MRLGDASAVDAETAAALNGLLGRWGLVGGPDDDRRVVRGRVVGACPGHFVRAYDKDMRSEERLGDAGIDAGEYEIPYTRAQFARAEKGTADLRVAVLNEAEREIASTPIIFNAGPVETAPDLVLPDEGLSEYERLTGELEPLLQGVAFEELTEEDIAFLYGETGIDAERIRWLVEAARRARESATDLEDAERIPPEPSHRHFQKRIRRLVQAARPAREAATDLAGAERIPPEAFYGLFRKNVPPGQEALLRTPLETLRGALEEAIGENIVPAALREQLKQLVAALQAWQVKLALAPAPQGERPSLGDLLGALPQRLESGQESAIALAVGPGGIDSLRQEHLDTLVRTGELTSEQGEHVALAIVAFHLADGSPAVTRGVLELRRSGTDEPRLRTVADLARLDDEDWQAVLAEAGVDPPPGMTVGGLAQELTSRVALVLPSDFLGHRVTALPEDLAALVEDGNGGEPPEPLVRLARRNPGLDLEDVLGGSGNARTKAKQIVRLVGLVAETWSRNPGRNLLGLDHSPDSADLESLELPDVSDEDREKILRNLRAQQRAFLVGRQDAGTALNLLDTGFDAARKIVALDPDEFVEASGLPPEQAVAAHYAATKASTGAAVKSVALYQLANSHAPAPARTSDDTRETFAKIPGYSTLFPDDFGFCDCVDCGSVLGLPAYFVDLMFFVEQHVLDYLPADLSIHLKARRDDLWGDLDLTCKNANEVVAYLDVVNEILEKYLRKKLGLAQGADVWERIAENNPNFALPFNLPLTRIETYLDHFGKRRLDAAFACRSDETVQARARLGLSVIDAEMITKPAAVNFSALTAAEMTFLSKLYVYLEIYPNGTVESPGFPIVFVSRVLDATGASREELGKLVATEFVGGATPPTIRSGRQSAQSLQNDTEVIQGLKAGHLDRLHRLYRLSRHVPWTIPELDRTVGRLTNNTLSSGLNDKALLRIARLLEHQERLGLSVEQLCGLWTELPNDPLDGGPGLFDALFNPPQLASLGTPLKYTSTPDASFQHPSFNPSGTSVPQDENTLARLLAGLRVSDEELVQLLVKLELPLGLGADHKLALSINNLTLLYRHATLARCLGLTIAGLFQLLETAGLPGQTSGNQTYRYVRDWSLSGTTLVDELGTVLATHRWTSESPFQPDEIAFITGGTVVDRTKLVAGEKRADPAAVVDTAVTQMLADRAFEFGDTVLSGMPNGGTKTITEDQSRRIIQANDTLFETPPGRTSLRLKKEISAGNVTIPGPASEFAVTAAEVAAELTKHSVSTLFPSSLAKAMDFSLEKTAELLRLSTQDATLTTSQFRTSLTKLLYGTSTDLSTDLGELLKVVKALAPYAVLYRDKLYDKTTLDAIYKNRATFAVAVQPLAPEAVRLAALFSRLATGPDPGFATSARPADVAAVLDVAEKGLTGMGAATSDVLARAVRTDSARVDALLPHLTATLPSNHLDALAMLAECLELTALLGVSGETLSDLALTAGAGTEYERLRKAADTLFAAFRTKYGSDEEFRKKMEPYEDILRSRKRNGLVAFIRFTEPSKFPLESDLYEYFLLDVEVEGCARTTRIAAAVFSLQLYVHRVLMHLERTDAYDVGEHARIPRDEWDWRRHYRTWQANRRVFLYPENYLEPGLRDDKTPLFRELEDTLLQQQSTEQNVRDAYARYLTGFDELAGLRIVAACWQPGNAVLKTPDLLHVFGVTSSEPPVYYYRTIAGLEKATKTSSVQFEPWRKVDLQMSSQTCSAVVYRGTLYVFWVEITTQPKTSLENGSSTFSGYKHKLTIKFSSLRLDGRWSAPQRLRILRDGGETQTIELDDPIIRLPTPTSEELTRQANGARQRGAVDVAMALEAAAEATKKPVATLDPLERRQTEPLDDYTLTHPLYVTAFPFATDSSLTIYAAQKSWTVDLFHRTATYKSLQINGHNVSALTLFVDPSNEALGIGDLTNRWIVDNDYAVSGNRLEIGTNDAPTGPIVTPATLTPPFAVIPINGDTEAAVVTLRQDVFYLRLRNGLFSTTRLGSTIADQTAEDLVSSSDGLARVLEVSYQATLEEADLPLMLSPAGVGTAAEQIGFMGPGGPSRPTESVKDLDFRGAVGDYYREIWCHIAWVIADYQHSQGRYSHAKRWYEAIFDPAAKNDPPAKPAYRRVWQFREFREEDVETMREALSSAAELTAYESDPFSPHAIARLRPGAYEKAMVMQYVDNLLDWGDSLFIQFTAESINEATMLYILALDILGPRARDAGDCGDELRDKKGNPIKKDYEHLAPALRAGHEFVIEAENLFVIEQLAREPSAIEFAKGVAYARSALEAENGALQALGNATTRPYGWNQAAPSYWAMSDGTPLFDFQLGTTLDGGNGSFDPQIPDGRTLVVEGDPIDPPAVGLPELPDKIERAGFSGHSLDTLPGLSLDDRLRQQHDHVPQVHAKPWQLLDTSIAFCIPDNKELRAYWDRVEGRLFNIRNCKDIEGKRRVPELFGPEIDPRLLIKLKAAGLTLDDVLNVTSGNVPPYRFTYLLEKARQHAGTVQSFGSALLSALEKRDGETLANLRTTHEQHLLKLRTQLQDLEIKAAEQTRDGLELQQQAAEYRRDYYRSLSQTGLNAWERTQQVSRHLVTSLHEIEAVVQLVRAVLSLVPQIGAPTAMKYGGMETSGAASGFASASQALAQAAEAASGSAGLEATFQRRDDDWKQQAALAQREVDQLKKQVAAAEFRIKIAERSLEVHNETLDQTEELYQFAKDRFTSLGLYTFLSTTLQRLYRNAYNAAFSMALLAEQAYRFERPADKSTLLGRDYWDQSKGGLLAGERLLLDLQALERRYLETDYRQLEVEQSFSLAQYDPAALAALRDVGACTFTVPELFFDLAYPGHYRRRTRAVRLSLPCVVGPYANASATLKQLDSEIRLEPTASPIPVPPRHSTSIAASSGQNDGGVFEFNFRDERYMPFEGSGAVSTWQLSLPKAFRPFDYGTISDVVLRISYTAEQDETLRNEVDDALGAAALALGQRLKSDGLRLLLSLRRDLPDVWRKLVTTPAGSDVEVKIDERHLPVILAGWLSGRALRDATPAKKPQIKFATESILLDASEKPKTPFGLTARAQSSPNATSLAFGNRGAPVDGLFSAPFAAEVTVEPNKTDVTLVFKISDAGNFKPPIPAPPAPPPTVTVDEAKFRDVMILATLTIAAT
jgi:Tc toxin complex TcA C-terminal TcB-binding domain/Neuraminidase-like domain/Salmonella virulence plasmid 28.1kDa A protein